MKKALILCLGILLIVSLCFSFVTKTEYKLTAGELKEVNNKVFNSEVVIYIDKNSSLGNASEINFINCTFNNGIKIIGDKSGFIRLLDGSQLQNGSKVTVVQATEGFVENATLYDDFIKLYSQSGKIRVESNALFTAISTDSVNFNGTEYNIKDFENCNTFCVASYYENGKPAIYKEGWNE